MSPNITNLTSTVTASSLAAALMALIGPWYRAHYGADLTMDQAAALVAVLAAVLHGIVAMPALVAAWIVSIQAAFAQSPSPASQELPHA